MEGERVDVDALIESVDKSLDELVAWIDTNIIGCIDVEQRGEQARKDFRSLARQVKEQRELLTAAYVYLDRFVGYDEALIDGMDTDAWCNKAEELGINGE